MGYVILIEAYWKENVMQAKVKSVKYIKVKGSSKSSPVHKTHFSIMGRSESAVIAYLKDLHKGHDIIITELEWA